MPSYAKNAKKYRGTRLFPKKKRWSRFDRKVGRIVTRTLKSQTEFKACDLAITQGCTSTPHIENLVNIARGTEYYQRIGREVTLRSIELRGIVQAQPTTNVPQTVRMQLVLDRQPSGALPNYSDIVTSGVLLGSYNLDNRKRFQTILDEYIDLGEYGQDNSHKTIIFKKPLFVNTVFNAGTTGDITDISENTLYLCLISDIPAATGKQPVFVGNVRFRFTDE